MTGGYTVIKHTFSHLKHEKNSTFMITNGKVVSSNLASSKLHNGNGVKAIQSHLTQLGVYPIKEI